MPWFRRVFRDIILYIYIARFLFQWYTLPDTPVHHGIEMSTCTLTVHFTQKQNALKLLNLWAILVIQMLNLCYQRSSTQIPGHFKPIMKIKCIICKIGNCSLLENLHIFKSWFSQLKFPLIAKWWSYLERAAFKIHISSSYLFINTK